MKNCPIEESGIYLIPPGEHIKDWLDDCGMPVPEFCRRMEISRPTYYRILKGEQSINAETARRLELVTGASAAFWSKLESDYRQALLRRDAEREAESQKAWIRSQPAADLIAAGFLPRDFHRKTVGEQMSALCAFYGVSSVDAYESIHTPYSFAARTVKGIESNSVALTAWLQMAARSAIGKIANLPAYNADTFETRLAVIRRKTEAVDSGMFSFREFLLTAKNEMEAAGVLVLYMRKVKGAKNLNGVAFWMNEHPVVVLTLHSCAFDRIVFSFFHEAAHILEGKHELIYVTDRAGSDIELAADARAAELLIPQSFDSDIRKSNGSMPILRALAKQIGVSVALVIGRYQKLCNRFFASESYQMPSITWNEIGAWSLEYPQ